MTLFDIPTPDIEEKLVVAVHKLPPIPTPPVTINAPDEVDVEFVESEIFKAEENVFAPAIVCVKLVTKPVLPDPAIGILNV